MRRFVPALLAVLSGAAFVLPLAAHAAGIPYFGPIIPALTCPAASGGGTYQISALGWGALVTVVNNVIAVVLTIAILFVAPLLIAYAGFLYLTSGASPGNRSKANGVLTDTVVGLVVALAGWIIVAAVMGALYNGSAGTWYSIINSGTGNPCLSVASSLNQVTLGSGATAQNATVVGSGTSGPLYSYGQGGACNAALIQQEDPSISSTEANQLACIAQQESTCGTKNQNGRWNTPIASAGGKASTAYGPYQVLLSSNSNCYNNAICEQAANTPGVSLNCASAFNSMGFTNSNTTVLNNCTTAASNVGCSAAAAQCAISQNANGFQGAYATDPLVSQCSNPTSGS